MRGLNVTAPFKEEALALADVATPRARRAGAANLLVFEPDGTVAADNTDGEGLLAALGEQAPEFDPLGASVALLGAGGAARGAALALLEAGAAEIRLVNRSAGRAEALARDLGDRARPFGLDRMDEALAGAGLVIGAWPQSAQASAQASAQTSAQAGAPPAFPLPEGPGPVVLDMVYRPLTTPLLDQARRNGLRTVDGLAMLIGQARPSYERLFGAPPPAGVDVRAVAEASLKTASLAAST